MPPLLQLLTLTILMKYVRSCYEYQLVSVDNSDCLDHFMSPLKTYFVFKNTWIYRVVLNIYVMILLIEKYLKLISDK